MTANRQASIHKYITILWIVLIIPSLVWWRDSVPWLVFMSVWANVASHWSSWQGARAEIEASKT